jgi:hypothetical protein
MCSTRGSFTEDWEIRKSEKEERQKYKKQVKEFINSCHREDFGDSSLQL